MITTTSVNDAFLASTMRILNDTSTFLNVTLDPDRNKSIDIMPGTPMQLTAPGIVRANGDGGEGKVIGLAASFAAPAYGKFGINQVGQEGQFSVVIGSNTTIVDIDIAVFIESVSIPTDFTKDVKVTAAAGGKLEFNGTGTIIGSALSNKGGKSIVIQLADINNTVKPSV